MTDQLYIDCECCGFHKNGCPNYVPVAEIRARYAAIAMEAAKPLRRETGSTRKGDSAARQGIAQNLAPIRIEIMANSELLAKIEQMREALVDARLVLRHGSSQSARMLLTKIDMALEGADGETIRDWWKPDPDDPFWMLEVRQGRDDAGSWLKNEHTFLTTREPAKALRFPSQFAADCALRQLPLSINHWFEPTEHSWIARTDHDLK